MFEMPQTYAGQPSSLPMALSCMQGKTGGWWVTFREAGWSLTATKACVALRLCQDLRFFAMIPTLQQFAEARLKQSASVSGWVIVPLNHLALG